MLKLRVLDLDSSLITQSNLFPPESAAWVSARKWGPQIRLACTFGTFERFRRWMNDELGATDPEITLYGSGDFHHVSLAFLQRVRGPFNLLVLDKHPDWMRGIPFLHCGTWLRHALRLPNLKCVFHCGGELDFDNMYRWLAPWHEIKAGRIVVFPAQRRFVRGRWAEIQVNPLLVGEGPLADIPGAALSPFRQDLRRWPLYISIDKDVLSAEDAAVNWDSGLLRLPDVVTILQTFLRAAEGRLAGADVLGDWSPIELGHRLNRLCDRLDHPSPEHDPAEAAARNRRANSVILQVLNSR